MVELVAIDRARRAHDGQRFEFAADREDLLDVVRVQGRNDRALVSLELEQALGLEPLHALANRDVRETQLGGNPADADALARAQLTREHPLAHVFARHISLAARREPLGIPGRAHVDITPKVYRPSPAYIKS